MNNLEFVCSQSSLSSHHTRRTSRHQMHLNHILVAYCTYARIVPPTYPDICLCFCPTNLAQSPENPTALPITPKCRLLLGSFGRYNEPSYHAKNGAFFSEIDPVVSVVVRTITEPLHTSTVRVLRPTNRAHFHIPVDLEGFDGRTNWRGQVWRFGLDIGPGRHSCQESHTRLTSEPTVAAKSIIAMNML